MNGMVLPGLVLETYKGRKEPRVRRVSKAPLLKDRKVRQVRRETPDRRVLLATRVKRDRKVKLVIRVRLVRKGLLAIRVLPETKVRLVKKEPLVTKVKRDRKVLKVHSGLRLLAHRQPQVPIETIST
jgi:hypothetical protein